MWQETVLLIEATAAFWLAALTAAFWLAALNVALLGRVISRTRGAARRAAAVVLACVCAGQAMEALLFLWLGDTSAQGLEASALLIVRTALLVSTGLISLLLLRALSLRR